MVPSSFIISHITPHGLFPHSLARSTAASVWPALTKTPPSFETTGNMCPGLTRSLDEESLFMEFDYKILNG